MKYYCIGIKGTGMSTLAQILSDLGNEVSGYDDATEHKFTQDGLEKRNIKIYYDNNHNIDKDTIVTYSVAFNEEHKELKRVKELGLKVVKYNEIIGNLMNDFNSIGVAGTHGKTTTSSIIKHILEQTIGCNYFIGAGDGKASKHNRYFVFESDEFNRHFTAYHPTYSIITNIELEHLECYKDIDDIRNTFEIFANQTKNKVIVNGDNEEIRKITFKTPVIYYGFKRQNDYSIRNIDLNTENSSFDIYYNDVFLEHFTIPLFGKHMIGNATAAIILCRELGISLSEIKENLLTFKNAKRRFAEEVINDTIIIDDYAHHPTEIKVTLNAVRQKYPNKKLVVVFVPNTYSRTRDFKDEFASSLKTADKVYLTEIDSNRESAEDYPGITSKIITDEIPDSELISINDIANLKKEAGSVVCFMGCAYVDGILNAFKKEIS